MTVVKQSLLLVASRWRHHYYYIQTNRSVQVGAQLCSTGSLLNIVLVYNEMLI